MLCVMPFGGKNDGWKKLAVFALCTYNVENAKFPGCNKCNGPNNATFDKALIKV